MILKIGYIDCILSLEQANLEQATRLKKHSLFWYPTGSLRNRRTYRSHIKRVRASFIRLKKNFF